MSLLFSGSDTQNLVYSGADVSAPPITLAGWVYPTAFTVSAHTIHLGRSSDSIPIVSILISSSTGIVHAQYRNDASTILTTDSTTALSTNTWAHVACTFGTGGTDQTQYINGAQDGTSGSGPSGAITLDRTAVARRIGVTGAYFTGRVAEVGVWNVLLTANEIAALGQGVSPLLIRPANLLNYLPLQTYHASNQVDWVGGRAFAVSGTADADHCRVVMPTGPKVLLPVTTVDITSAVGLDTTVGHKVTLGVEAELALAGGLDSSVGNIVALETTVDLAPSIGGESNIGHEVALELDSGLSVGLDTTVGGVVTVEADNGVRELTPPIGLVFYIGSVGTLETTVVLTAGSSQDSIVSDVVTLTVTPPADVFPLTGLVGYQYYDIHSEEARAKPPPEPLPEAGGISGSLRLPRRGNDPKYWPRVPKAPYESPPEEILIEDLPEFQFLDLDPLVEDLNWRLEAERERQLEFIKLFEEYKNGRSRIH